MDDDTIAAVRTSHRWVTGETDVWSIGLTWASLEGRQECIGVELRPGGDQPRPVLASEVRAIPLASIIQQARFALEVSRPSTTTTSAVVHKPETPVRRGRGRPSLLTGGELVECAEVYLLAWRRGEPPTGAVADRFHISTSAAARRVALARKAGLLGPTTAGRPSGPPRDTAL